MTKARARAEADDGDGSSSPVDHVLACLGAVHPAPRELTCNPTGVDGRPACKLFLRGKSCSPDCHNAHDSPELRPKCWPFERYGVCPRDVVREKDHSATPCWFPHVPSPELLGIEKPHLALQCELGFADRVAGRCRELLGPDSVVQAGRFNLARAADCVLFVSCDTTTEGKSSRNGDASVGVANTMRRLSTDPHLLSSLKRAYCVGVDGVDPRSNFGGAGYVTVVGASKENLLAEVRAAIPKLLRYVHKRSKKQMLVKARCFPKWCADATYAALERDGDVNLEIFQPTAHSPTHYIDVVCVKNRAHITVWPTSFVEESIEFEEVSRDEEKSCKTETETPQENLPSTLRPYPALPKPGSCTFEYLLTQHCERVKEARADKNPMCRAYFKLEEAADRAGIPITKDWHCVDVGAAPGGWTQWISDRLLMLEAGNSALDGEHKGTVWAIDPGLITLDPFPKNVVHIKMMAEAAIAGNAIPIENVSMLVCDANASPAVVTQILLSVKPALKPGAYLVTTFKNFCKGYSEWRSQMKAARAEFAENGFREEWFGHLFANCAQEFTFVAKFEGN